MSPRPDGVLETCLYAPDLAAAERFYQDVLGLELVAREQGRHAFFRCGRQMVLVFDPAASAQASAIPPHGARGPGHVAFAVGPEALEVWRAHFAALGVPTETEAAWPGGARSLYVRDPAGNSIELAPPALWGLDR